MIGQGAIEFVHHPVGEPGIAEHDDRAHGMREPAQVFLLFFSECHQAIIVVSPCPSVRKAVPVGSPNTPRTNSSSARRKKAGARARYSSWRRFRRPNACCGPAFA